MIPTPLSDETLKNRRRLKNRLSNNEQALKTSTSDIFYAAWLIWEGKLNISSPYKFCIGEVRGHQVTSMRFYKRNKFVISKFEGFSKQALFLLGLVNQVQYRAGEMRVDESLNHRDLSYFKHYIREWKQGLSLDILTIREMIDGVATKKEALDILFKASNAFYSLNDEKVTSLKPYTIYILVAYSKYITKLSNRSTFNTILLRNSKRITTLLLAPDKHKERKEYMVEMVSKLDDIFKFMDDE